MGVTDTICAIATPPGEGGIGIIRISGEKAVAIASQVFRSSTGRTVGDFMSHTLHVGELWHPESGERLDEVLVAVMKAPHTYTREDVVEFHCHGSPLVLRFGLEALIHSGARLADPGEFTKRAFLNGRLDLAQAEAVMDLIQARSQTGIRVALEQLRGRLSEEVEQFREELLRLLVEVEAGIDFTEDGITFISSEALVTEVEKVTERIRRLIGTSAEGRIVREGATVVLAGRPNVGKSSLLNALVRADRAIVADLPGTTRDVLEEFVNIRGIPIRLLDTAGLRDGIDVVEKEGVRRSYEALERADMIVAVLDGSMPLAAEDRRLLEEAQIKPSVVVVNKSDLPSRCELGEIGGAFVVVRTSAQAGTGLEDLRDAVRGGLLDHGLEAPEGVMITHLRHQTALVRARESLDHVLDSVGHRMPPECIALDLRAAINAIGEIIGETRTDEVLDRIFQEFCIGK